ncbi:MAG: superoxide dismutase [Pseudomonadota bacterium]
MPFDLPELPYAVDALAPHMSAETLEFHHGKHHRAYVTKLNELVAGTEFESMGLEELIRKSYGDAEHEAIFNNAGQHWNHAQFWLAMKPKGGGAMPGELERRIAADFGSVDAFKRRFVEQGVAQFGSGWVWLVDSDGKLEIMKTANALNPLPFGKPPLLVCDVWEHAYYIDYRNRRPDFLKAFIDYLVDWERVATRLGQSGAAGTGTKAPGTARGRSAAK